MPNLIAEKSAAIEWFSNLFPFFRLIEADVRARSWIWSDVELSVPLPVTKNIENLYEVTGDVLFEFVSQQPQFIWSVLSALCPDGNVDPVKIGSIPYADGNETLWSGSPKPQHPGAEFEIVCWDSSATLLIGAEDRIADAFMIAYPDAVDLNAANDSRSD